jgi:hypothetical protein
LEHNYDFLENSSKKFGGILLLKDQKTGNFLTLGEVMHYGHHMPGACEGQRKVWRAFGVLTRAADL